MIGFVTTIQFGILMVLPFASAAAAWFLYRKAADAVKPPALLVLLVISQIVNLVCSTYLAYVTINVRVFQNINPPELLPVTLQALITPLAMGPIVVLVLWRSTSGGAIPGPRGPKGEKGDTGKKGDTGQKGDTGKMGGTHGTH